MDLRNIHDTELTISSEEKQIMRKKEIKNEFQVYSLGNLVKDGLYLKKKKKRKPQEKKQV